MSARKQRAKTMMGTKGHFSQLEPNKFTVRLHRSILKIIIP